MQLFRSIWASFAQAWAAERAWKAHTFPSERAEAEVPTQMLHLHAEPSLHLSKRASPAWPVSMAACWQLKQGAGAWHPVLAGHTGMYSARALYPVCRPRRRLQGGRSSSCTSCCRILRSRLRPMGRAQLGSVLCSLMESSRMGAFSALTKTQASTVTQLSVPQRRP